MHKLWETLGHLAEPLHGPGPQITAQKTILIIDDHQDSLRDMCLALAAERYHVESADTAPAALRKVTACRPDLILVDARVPAADGTRLARRLLADRSLIHIPLVALTEIPAHSQVGPRGLFDGEIGKPIDARRFPEQVRDILASPRIRPPGRPVSVPAGIARPDASQPPAGLLEMIDAGLPDSQFAQGTRESLQRLAEVVEGTPNSGLAAWLQQAGHLSHAATARARCRFQSAIRLCREALRGDADTAPGMAELRAGYLDHRRAELAALDAALRNADFTALQKAGHNLKGTGSAYGFSELTDLGRALEAAGKGRDAAAVEGLLDQMDAFIGMVRPETGNEDHYGARI